MHWTSPLAALLVSSTAVLPVLAAHEQDLAKRCRVCPLDLPQCPPCESDKVCQTTPQTCDECPVVACVGLPDSGSGSGSGYDTSVLPSGYSFSSFSLMPVPAGVTPASVHHGSAAASSAAAATTQPGGPLLSASPTITSTTTLGAASTASSTQTEQAASTTVSSATTSASASPSAAAKNAGRQVAAALPLAAIAALLACVRV